MLGVIDPAVAGWAQSHRVEMSCTPRAFDGVVDFDANRFARRVAKPQMQHVFEVGGYDPRAGVLQSAFGRVPRVLGDERCFIFEFKFHFDFFFAFFERPFDFFFFFTPFPFDFFFRFRFCRCRATVVRLWSRHGRRGGCRGGATGDQEARQGEREQRCQASQW